MIVCFACILFYEFLVFAFILKVSGKRRDYFLAAMFSTLLDAGLLFFVGSSLSKFAPVASILLFVPLLIVLAVWPALFKQKYNIRTVHHEQSFFSFKKASVMFFFPHPDDEINIAASTIKQFIKAGNEIKVCYITNGDYYETTGIRLKAAINSLRILGVKEHNIVFLGYGDSCVGKHIYNRPETEPVTSHCGRKSTYALKEHPEYHYTVSRKHALYTRQNLKADMKQLILSEEPDGIFCVDYDVHADHRMSSLIFEEVMGEILLENPQYAPRIFKGFSYSTAYFAVDDFYSQYLKSTSRPEQIENIFYKWEDRIRVPVSQEFLAYTKRSSILYKMMQAHSYQGIMKSLGRVSNADQIFWERESRNELYRASVNVSSGVKEYLYDFKLFDCKDVLDKNAIPFAENIGGLWKPWKDDKSKEISVCFDREISVKNIKIYSNCGKSNILSNVKLEMSNGYEEVFDIDDNIVVKEVDSDGISGIKLKFGKFGEECGISELEVLKKAPVRNEIIKIVNREEDYVYLVNVKKGKNYDFQLYTYPRKMDFANIMIESQKGLKVSLERNTGEIHVKVNSKQKRLSLKVTDEDSGNSDEIFLVQTQMFCVMICQAVEYTIDLIRDAILKIVFFFVIKKRNYCIKRGRTVE